MRLTLDTDRGLLILDEAGRERTLDLYSKEAFEHISRQWVRVGWSQKYPYTFSWLGRPIMQLPEDMVRAQEVIYRVRPDVIVETSVADGGALVYHASLCKLTGRGRVVGIDVHIRPHSRAALGEHPLALWITLIEGSSIDPHIVARVKAGVRPDEKVLVFLDSSHSRAHVRAELEAYHGLVTPGSYVVATGGILRDLHDVPRGRRDWIDDHPAAAAADFAAAHPEFALEQPPWPFSESALTENVTHWPGGWLRRR